LAAFSALKDPHLHLPLAHASVKPLQSSFSASNLQETGTLSKSAKVAQHSAGFKRPIATLFLQAPTPARSFAPLDGFGSELRASQAVTRSVRLPLRIVTTATRGCLDLHSSLAEFE